MDLPRPAAFGGFPTQAAGRGDCFGTLIGVLDLLGRGDSILSFGDRDLFLLLDVDLDLDLPFGISGAFT